MHRRELRYRATYYCIKWGKTLAAHKKREREGERCVWGNQKGRSKQISKNCSILSQRSLCGANHSGSIHLVSDKFCFFFKWVMGRDGGAGGIENKTNKCVVRVSVQH